MSKTPPSKNKTKFPAREPWMGKAAVSGPRGIQVPGYIHPKTLDYRAFKARSDNQHEILDILRTHGLTFIVGPAGTGKTLMAAAIAMEYLQAGRIETIVAARPAVEAGDPIGFLKGDLKEKMGPFVRPILDNLSHFIGSSNLDALMNQGTIEVTSMSYLRGRTFNNAVVILDEMQNATPAMLKLALTRLGENCTVIVTMDPSQCDLDDAVISAAEDIERFRGRQGIAIIELSTRDVVRSKLCRTILNAYANSPE